tara:strand:+ start:1260 stop:2222 length:963 start_codon:yes stop_codon:yes gene_type:complete
MKSLLQLLLLFTVFVIPPSLSDAQVIEMRPGGQVVIKEGPNLEEADEVETEETYDDEKQLSLNAYISTHILKLAEAEREKRMKFMQIVIDDVARLCELDNKQQNQLQIAAKGASERSMRDWHLQAERYFRQRLDGTDADAAKEMLEGMTNVNFGGNRSEQEGESLKLWKDTLVDVLTEKQITHYESVVEQRYQDRIAAFSKMSLTTIDSHLRLTPDQKEKMEELINQSAIEYLDDVQRYWGEYFEKAMLLSLANASEDAILKAILTDDQFDRLKSATSSFDHFWESKKRSRKEKKKGQKDDGQKEGGQEATNGLNLDVTF